MGASSSSMMETISKTVNETTIDILNKNQNDATQSAVTTQVSNISGLEIMGCRLDISQQASVTMKSMQSISASTSAELITQIASALEQKAQAAVKAESSLGSQPSNAAAVTKITQEVTNTMKANLTMENLNKIIQAVNIQQKQDIRGLKYDACNGASRMKILEMPGLDDETRKAIIKGVNDCYSKSPLPDCNISQITTVNLVAEQITTSVMDMIAKNETAQKLQADLKAEASAKSGGIGDMIGSILKGLLSGLFGGMGRYAMMVSVCCCVCCCCLILLVVGGSMLGGGGKGAAPTANAGSGTNNLSPELR